jgi:hypothetical protein
MSGWLEIKKVPGCVEYHRNERMALDERFYSPTDSSNLVNQASPQLKMRKPLTKCEDQ